MTKDDGGPAFPTDDAHWVSSSMFHYSGMTLRDHFAGLAMHGYMGPDYDMSPSTRAAEAYKLADAMLKARQA